jgi:hypothetical protein
MDVEDPLLLRIVDMCEALNVAERDVALLHRDVLVVVETRQFVTEDVECAVLPKEEVDSRIRLREERREIRRLLRRHFGSAAV